MSEKHLGTSALAREAREALNAMDLEAWVKDWGHVLCAALDELEASHAEVSARALAAASATMAGMEAVKAVQQAVTACMLKTGWVLGRPVLEATPERQAASEAMVRLLMDVTVNFAQQANASLTVLGSRTATDPGAAFARGNPAGRAKASAILAELAREFPDGDAGANRLQETIQRLRAALGGSNVPSGEREEPS